MDVSQLQTQYLNLGNSMYREGYLDGQFTMLQKLAEEADHQDFVLEIISIFFEESDRLLQDLGNALDGPAPDFDQVTTIARDLRMRSVSIGAKRVKNVFMTFKECIKEQNLQGCMMCLEQVKQEYADVKSRLETLKSLHLQIKAAGGVIPIVQ